MFDETFNPDPMWEEIEQIQQPTCSSDYDPPLTDKEYQVLAEYFGACGEDMPPNLREEAQDIADSVDPTIAKDEHKYDYAKKDVSESKTETESERDFRIEREIKQRLCQHKNKYINDIGKLRFWVCPDCKKDLGDVR